MGNSTPPQFTSPRKALKWAKAEIENFQKESSYFLHNSFKTKDRHLGNGSIVVSVIDVSESRDHLEKSASRIIADLRTTLDHALNSACEALGSKHLKAANFPFAENEKALDRRLSSPTGPYRGIPASLHPILKSFGPHEGDNGNDTLCLLNNINNKNKHQTPLESLPDMQSLGILNAHGATLSCMNSVRISEKEIEVFRFTPDPETSSLNVSIVMGLYIAGEYSDKNATANDIFTKMYDIVEDIIKSIETEVRMIQSTNPIQGEL